MGAYDDALAALRTNLGQMAGVRGVSGPQSAPPQVTPWVIVRGDRGAGVLGALEVTSHRAVIFVLVNDYGGGDDESNYNTALSYLDPVKAVMRADGAAGDEIVESPYEYSIGKVTYGGQDFWALTYVAGIETKEETAA